MKAKRPLFRGAILAVLGLAAAGSALAQQAPSPRPAVEAVIDLFKERPLVGLNDAHGLAQEEDFYAAVVRHPRFAREVGNLVLEGLTAQHQAIVDRYVNGEEVPYAELRQAWTDSVSSPGPATDIGGMGLLGQVRLTNLTLPPDQRIRVWLGEPPADWSRITAPQHFSPILSQRDRHGAEVIVRNILAQNRKALVIYGGAHFTPAPDRSRRTPTTGSEAMVRGILTNTVPFEMMTPELAAAWRADPPESLPGIPSTVTFIGGDRDGRDTYDLVLPNGTLRLTVALDADGKLRGYSLRPTGANAPVNIRTGVEADHPGVWFIVSPYTGYEEKGCSQALEQFMAGWPAPSLVRMQGSSLEREAARPGCRPARWADMAYNDAVLYLGPAADLTYSPDIPDPYLEGAYLAEITRRQVEVKRQPAPVRAGFVRASPVKFRDYDAEEPPQATQEQRLAAFQSADRNRDGRLDRAEYWEVLQALGYAEQIDTLFLQRDVNRDYFVSAEEYRTPIPQ